MKILLNLKLDKFLLRHIKSVINNIRKNKPPDGLVQVLTVTEKQFEKMEFITGSFESDVIDSDERLVIL